MFYLLFNVLDCSDGQLARIKKNGTSVGRLLDGIADYIAAIAIYAGIAIGYTNKPGQPHCIRAAYSSGRIKYYCSGIFGGLFQNAIPRYCVETKGYL